ncbi:MAG: DUF423 domain-containing protein [Planctomycetota bacterium]
MSRRATLSVGALLAAAGVALGAFGAHGLEDRLLQLGYEAELQQRLDWFETGVKYHLFHALSLVVVTRLGKSRVPGFAFLLGILLFSGSLYAMTFLSADWKKLGAIVPLGGLSFIVGWIAVAVSTWREDSKPID